MTAYGTINSGSIANLYGIAPAGILAGYDPDGLAAPGVTGTVAVNNFANITALAGSGINASNYGNGDVTVNDNYGEGAVSQTNVSGVQYGIFAGAFSGGIGNVAVNVGADATISTSTGASALFGVDAFSEDAGNITVATSAGDAITSGSVGIAAFSEAAADPATSAITVTAAGNINSGLIYQNGNPPACIIAGYLPNNSATPDANVAGSVSVTSGATISAAAGYGIWAFNFGTGNVTVTAEARCFDHRTRLRYCCLRAGRW